MHQHGDKLSDQEMFIANINTDNKQVVKYKCHFTSNKYTVYGLTKAKPNHFQQHALFNNKFTTQCQSTVPVINR